MFKKLIAIIRQYRNAPQDISFTQQPAVKYHQPELPFK